MKLKALDQIHISSVKSDSLRPGEKFEVSEDFGAELMKRHPTRFEILASESEEVEKAEPAAPANKAKKAAPSNK